MSVTQGKLDDLKKNLLMTFILLGVYRLASQIPVPGVDPVALKAYFSSNSGGIFDLINTFSGGAFKRFSILALGIMPYITTSIIFSLLGEVIPQIQEMSEDSDGQKKIQKLTRYFTVLLCCFQGYGLASVFESFQVGGSSASSVVTNPGLLFKVVTMITLAGGTMFLLWLGERITEFGLENGVSLIIFTGIIVELPSELLQKFTLYQSGELKGIDLLFTLAVILATFYIVSFIERSIRGIPVQYAKKVVNNRVFGGSQTLPMKVDTAGVMPPILASSLIAAPTTFASFVATDSVLKPYLESIQLSLYPGKLLFNIVFSFLIIYMAYFYAPIQTKTNKISEMLQKSNGFIPGVRPGAKTKEYLDYILNRLTFFGSIYLVVICVLPTILTGGQTRFGGTSMLILVSVAVRVVMNIQSFLYSDLYQQSYKSKGKFKGSKKRF